MIYCHCSCVIAWVYCTCRLLPTYNDTVPHRLNWTRQCICMQVHRINLHNTAFPPLNCQQRLNQSKLNTYAILSPCFPYSLNSINLIAHENTNTISLMYNVSMG